MVVNESGPSMLISFRTSARTSFERADRIDSRRLFEDKDGAPELFWQAALKKVVGRSLHGWPKLDGIFDYARVAVFADLPKNGFQGHPYSYVRWVNIGYLYCY